MVSSPVDPMSDVKLGLTLFVVLLVPVFLPSCSQLVNAGPADDWKVSIQVKANMTAWTGLHEDRAISDRAFLVTADVTYKGDHVKGATLFADVRSANQQRYWFKDGTASLYDIIQYDGRDDRGRQAGPVYGNGTNDGVYANMLELGDQYFGADIDWFINVTVYAPGLPVHVASAKVHVSVPAEQYGHRVRWIDLDTGTASEDWAVRATPGQNLPAKLILSTSKICDPDCCHYNLSSWGSPFAEWGQEFPIAQGCMTNGDLTLAWNYTVPSVPGTYLLMLSETNTPWRPHYNESVFFVGRVVVDTAAAAPKVELVSPTNGTKLGSYKVTLQWKSSGFSPTRPTFIVLMDDQDGRSVTLARTDGTTADTTFYENTHRSWSVLGFDGSDRYYSAVWNFSVERNLSADAPPTAKLTAPVDKNVSKYHDISFAWSGSDPEGDLITYTFEVRYASNGSLVNTHDMLGTSYKLWLPEGDLVWTVIPRDPWKTGKCLDGRWNLTIKVPPNTAPYSTLVSPPSGKVFGNQSIDFRWDGYDAEDDKIQYKLEVRDAFTGDLYVERYIFGKNTTLWLPPWSYTWTVLPSDGQLWGWCKNGTWSLAVSGPVNRMPEISSLPPKHAWVGKEYGYQVKARDPDGDMLTFSLMDAPANMTIDVKGGFLGWTPGPADIGARDVTVLVMDGHGGKATQTFQVYIARKGGPVHTGVQGPAPYLLAAVIIIAACIIGASARAVVNRKK